MMQLLKLQSNVQKIPEDGMSNITFITCDYEWLSVAFNYYLFSSLHVDNTVIPN